MRKKPRLCHSHWLFSFPPCSCFLPFYKKWEYRFNFSARSMEADWSASEYRGIYVLRIKQVGFSLVLSSVNVILIKPPWLDNELHIHCEMHNKIHFMLYRRFFFFEVQARRLYYWTQNIVYCRGKIGGTLTYAHTFDNYVLIQSVHSGDTLDDVQYICVQRARAE